MHYNIITVISAIFASLILVKIIKAIRSAFLVPEGYAGLLYHEGKFIEVLGAGRHIRWGRHFTLDAQDIRKTSLPVPGQEVITADNVGLKISLVVAMQVTDPAKAAHETQSWRSDIYNFAQIALRSIVGAVTVEILLHQRLEIGAQLLARVQPEALKIGIGCPQGKAGRSSSA